MKGFITVLLSILFINAHSQNRIMSLVDDYLPDTICVASFVSIDTSASDSLIRAQIFEDLRYMYNTYWDSHTTGEYAYVPTDFKLNWPSYTAKKDYPAMFCTMFDMPFRIETKITGSNWRIRITTCVEECNDMRRNQNIIQNPAENTYLRRYDTQDQLYRKVPLNEELDLNGIYYNIHGQRVNPTYNGVIIEKLNN